jgi:hypothetical protein
MYKPLRSFRTTPLLFRPPLLKLPLLFGPPLLKLPLSGRQSLTLRQSSFNSWSDKFKI